MGSTRHAIVVQQTQGRLDSLRLVESGLRRRDRLFIAMKVTLGIVTVCLAVWLAKFHTARIVWLFVPIVLLLALFAMHERVLTALRNNRLLRDYYDRSVARLEDRWFTQAPLPTSTIDTGERYLEDLHPYARDLDLFGPGSLYHLLCTARTRSGHDTLAAWLLAPAAPSEIEQRQAAVQELAPLFDFRERLALAGAALNEKATATAATPEAFAQWAESSDALDRRLRLPAILLALLWIAAVAAWQLFPPHPIYFVAAIVMSIANLAFGYRHRGQRHQSAAAIDAATADIDALASVLAVMETQPFTSQKLTALQSKIRSASEPVSRVMGRLQRSLDWFSSSDNWFVKVLDPFLFWTLQCIISIEDWRRAHGTAVRGWLQAIGEMEALTALSVYAFEHPDDTFPTFTVDTPLFHADDFAHPLLPREGVVCNSLHLDRRLQLLIISGPNMAGKSTFIRSVGVNAVLAQAGAPVRARSMTLSPLAVAASICVLDSLQGGLSRFYAEILRLKEIDTLSRKPLPVLFLLDELLSGTNSHDRRIGTESMVRGLVERNAIGLVTTHDLALAEIADNLQGRAQNYHFEDRYEDGKLHFEYTLTPGIVQTSNALQLMRSIGLDVGG